MGEIKRCVVVTFEDVGGLIAAGIRRFAKALAIVETFYVLRIKVGRRSGLPRKLPAQKNGVQPQARRRHLPDVGA